MLFPLRCILFTVSGMPKTQFMRGFLLGALLAVLCLIRTSSSQPMASGSCDAVANRFLSAHRSCSQSQNCSQMTCSWSVGSTVAQLTVYNCEDPVKVVMAFSDYSTGHSCSRTYFVSGQEATYDEVALDGVTVAHVTASRNASHLHFVASSGGSSSSVLVPAVDLPLSSSTCMYDDFEEAAREFTMPSILQYSCAAENLECHGFQCNFTGFGESYSTCITIEPCDETLQITIWDSGDNVQYDEVFNDTRTVNLQPRVGPAFSLRVHLNHYNYSMDAQLSAIITDIAFPLLPYRRFILDRSQCSPFIPYPAAPGLVSLPIFCNTTSPPAGGACSDLSAGYSSSNPGCTLTSDCQVTQCSLSGNRNSKLVVFNCEDPVRAVFTLTEATGVCERTYDVSGPGLLEDDLMAGEHIVTSFTRNASHLNFSISSTGKGKSSVVPFIPLVTLPLLPDKCMFGDFVNTSKNLILPPPLTQSCVAETSKCGGVWCNFTTPIPRTETYETCITIDPCAETIQIIIQDSLDSSVFDEVFNESRSIPIKPTLAQPFTLYVILDHYNYSMETTMIIELNLTIILRNISILPRQRFILDRTKCNPFISYPAAPDKWGTQMMCRPVATVAPNSSVTPESSTTSRTTEMQHTSEASGTAETAAHSRLALAIILPVSLVTVAALIATSVLAVLIFLRCRKKRSEINFQRVAFNDIDFEDTDEDD